MTENNDFYKTEKLLTNPLANIHYLYNRNPYGIAMVLREHIVVNENIDSISCDDNP